MADFEPVTVSIVLSLSYTRPSFPRVALRSLAGEKKPHIQLRLAAPTDLTWVPQEFDVLILNGVGAVPHLLRQQLKDFLDNGGTLIIIPGPEAGGTQSLAVLQQQFGLPPMELTPQMFNSPVSMDGQALTASILHEVFKREIQLSELPGVSQLYPMSPRGTDEVILWAEGRRPLLARTPYSNGAAFLFAMPFHLAWTDMPLKGSFVPLWHRLTYWRAASPILSDIRVADRPVLEIMPRQATQAVTLTAPDGITSLINPDVRTRTVTLGELNRPGIYQLSTKQRSQPGNPAGVQEDILFRVNISGEELAASTLKPSALRSLLGPSRVFILEDGAPVEEWVQKARFGRELWRPLLYLMVVLLIAEMILGNIYRTPKRPNGAESP